ncbi:hypothetical protein QVD17_40430 [Tagetes erecta]|uniref:Uncharacterized protein n=1 Tax=Tagetes erecta TaxID=13708 RepID=A0AAD8NAS1_TARER|nr:hypothetical protein QVD17_40430 [Tagetes erecta]
MHLWGEPQFESRNFLYSSQVGHVLPSTTILYGPPITSAHYSHIVYLNPSCFILQAAQHCSQVPIAASFRHIQQVSNGSS